MKWDCDALLDPDERKWSPVYRRSAVNPFPELDLELLIFMATPGFLPMHFTRLFGWSVPVPTRVWEQVRAGVLDPYRVQGQVNATSVTVDDGLALLDRLCGGWAIFPYWCSKAVVGLSLAQVRDRWDLSYHAANRLRSGAGWGLGGVWLGQTGGWEKIGSLNRSKNVVDYQRVR